MANNSIAGKEEKKIKGTEFIDEFSKEIYEHTYSYENEDINQTHLRIAKDLAKIENDQKYWENQFLWAMEDFKFVPGGRIISNAGTGLEGACVRRRLGEVALRGQRQGSEKQVEGCEQ